MRAPGPRNYYSHCSSGPPVHFTHQTLTISSFGYLLWRNKRHCYPFYYSKKKSKQEDLNSHPENKQCNAVLHVALPTAPRAVDGSKGGLTNLYLGLNHPRWIGCMQMSTRGLWLAVCKWVRTGVRNCSGINNLAPGPGPCEYCAIMLSSSSSRAVDTCMNSSLTNNSLNSKLPRKRAPQFDLPSWVNVASACAVHVHEISSFSSTKKVSINSTPVNSVLNQRFKTLILPSQIEHKRTLRVKQEEDEFVFVWHSGVRTVGQRIGGGGGTEWKSVCCH